MFGAVECRNCGAGFPDEVCYYCGARTFAICPRPSQREEPRRVPDGQQGKVRGRPEALLERQILLALGQMPDVLVCKNEVGAGFTAGALAAILMVLPSEYHSKVRQAAARYRITFGLGVGSSDLLVIVGPRSHAIMGELKSEDGRLSPEQERYHRAARARGAHVETWRSVEEARRAVEEVRGGGR